jgi:hypothetical protein
VLKIPEIPLVILMIIYRMGETIITHTKSKGHWDWWLKGITLKAETERGREKKFPKKEKKKEETLPYARDRVLNEANKKRFGEKARPNPYSITKGDAKES